MVPSGQFVEVQYSNAEGFPTSGHYTYLYDKASAINLHNDGEDRFVCVRLRNRALNGQFGEPSTYCAADVASFELGNSDSFECTSEGILHEGKLVTESRTAKLLSAGTSLPDEPATTEVTRAGANDENGESGCALGPSPRPAFGLAWLTVAAAAIFARARRSAARRQRQSV